MALKDNIRYLRRKKEMSQDDLAKLLGYKSFTTIQKWESGVAEPPFGKVQKLAEIFGVDINALVNGAPDISDPDPLPPNVFRPKLKKVPLLGTTAAGEPILSEEHFEGYVDAYDMDDADFCLRVQGDSMIGIGINDGDIVFFKSQPEVENGQVAVVRIDGEAVTLKRFFRQGASIILQAENPSLMPMIFNADNCDDFRILGLAIIKQSVIK